MVDPARVGRDLLIFVEVKARAKLDDAAYSVTERNQRDAYQAIAPAVESGLYLVPKVIE